MEIHGKIQLKSIQIEIIQQSKNNWRINLEMKWEQSS